MGLQADHSKVRYELDQAFSDLLESLHGLWEAHQRAEPAGGLLQRLSVIKSKQEFVLFTTLSRAKCIEDGLDKLSAAAAAGVQPVVDGKMLAAGGCYDA